MPSWVTYVLVGFGVLLIVAGALVGGWLFYQRQVRRAVVRLFSAREAVQSAATALENVLDHLSAADDETLTSFASDLNQEDRRVLHEISLKMRIVGEDLAGLPLPKAAWPTATLLERAAFRISEEAGRVGDLTDPVAVLEALAAVDTATVRQVRKTADDELDVLRERYGVEDTAVYGGGLYI